MRQSAFTKVVLAADAEHDLKIFAFADLRQGRFGEKGEELLRLAGTRRDPQCFEREAGVANAGEAIIPVAVATHGFRQGSRWRSDNRPGWVVGEGLKHTSAVCHHVASGTGVVLVQPAPTMPALHGV